MLTECFPGGSTQCRRHSILTCTQEMAPHSSILSKRTPGTEELGGLQSIESQSWTRLRVWAVAAHTIQSFCCTADINTVLSVDYTSVKNTQKTNYPMSEGLSVINFELEIPSKAELFPFSHSKDRTGWSAFSGRRSAWEAVGGHILLSTFSNKQMV